MYAYMLAPSRARNFALLILDSGTVIFITSGSYPGSLAPEAILAGLDQDG